MAHEIFRERFLNINAAWYSPGSTKWTISEENPRHTFRSLYLFRMLKNMNNEDVFGLIWRGVLGGLSQIRRRATSSLSFGALALSVVLVFLASLPARAVTLTWTGSGTNPNWSTVGNWASGTPGSSSTNDLVFNNGLTLSSSNDLASLTASSMLFSSTAATNHLAGNLLTLSGSLTDNAIATQYIDLPMALTGSSVFVVNGGPLTVNGSLSGPNGGLMKTGTGTLTLNGTSNLGGGTTIEGGGTLVLNGSLTSGTSGVDCFVGNSGTGALLVNSSATLNTGRVWIGYSTTASGSTTIAGGTLNASAFDLVVGNLGTGVLNVTGGAVSNYNGYVGNNAGSSGTAIVTGGSWNTSNSLVIGNSGTGTLTLGGSGAITVASGTGKLTLANIAGSIGVMNLGGTDGTIGTLNVSAVSGGSGTASVNLKNTLPPRANPSSHV